MTYLQDFRPFRTFPHEVVLGSTTNEIAQPYERSIFDAIVGSHSCSGFVATKDPFSATTFARNFIRAAWEEWITRNEWDIHDTLLADERQHTDYRGTDVLEDLEFLKEQNNKTLQGYQKLMQNRQRIQEGRRFLRAITWAFRCRDTEYRKQQKVEGLRHALLEESTLWNTFDERLQVSEAIIGDHMETYSQRAAMEESYVAKLQTAEANIQTAAANRMSKSSGQLTKIATIVVPCTFVGSIFSMGGKFAAGESLFFVYWLISIPATLALLGWVIYQDISDFREKVSKVGWRKYFFNFHRGRPARDEEKVE